MTVHQCGQDATVENAWPTDVVWFGPPGADRPYSRPVALKVKTLPVAWAAPPTGLVRHLVLNGERVDELHHGCILALERAGRLAGNYSTQYSINAGDLHRRQPRWTGRWWWYSISGHTPCMEQQLERGGVL